MRHVAAFQFQDHEIALIDHQNGFFGLCIAPQRYGLISFYVALQPTFLGMSGKRELFRSRGDGFLPDTVIIRPYAQGYADNDKQYQREKNEIDVPACFHRKACVDVIE